jgi:hypothetical protein
MKENRTTPGYAWATALALAIALFLYLRSLWGGLLSDDLFQSLLGIPEGTNIRPDWARIAADFTGPWVGMEGTPLFRPMISLSYGWDMAFGGGAPWAFHLTNLLFLLGGVFALARILFYLGVQDGRILFPLLLLAIHPAGVESIVWISGRVSSMELTLRLLSLWVGARYLLRPSMGRLGLFFLFGLADLLTKESAAVLPFWLFALDFFLRPDQGILRRLRFHLRFAPLWLGYIIWRFLALGSLFPSGQGTQAQGLSLSHYFITLPSKLEALLVPGLRGHPLLLLLGALALLTLLRTQLGGRRSILALGTIVLLIFLEAVPSFTLSITPNLTGSRLVFGALPLLAPLLLLRQRGTPMFRLGLLALVPLLGLLLWVQQQRFNAYDRAFEVMAKIHKDIGRLGAGADPEHPLAILSTPSALDGVPVLNPNAVFPLAEPPFQKTQIPIVGLNFVTTRFDGSDDLFLDARPIRAMGGFGARLLEWNGKELSVVSVPEFPKRIPLREEEPGLLRIGGAALSPFQIAGLDLRFAKSREEGSTPRRLFWLGPDQSEAAQGDPFWTGMPLPFGAKVNVDLTRSVPFLALGRVAGIGGFKLQAAEPLVSVQAFARPLTIPLPHRLRGRRLRLEELDQWVSPKLPLAEMALVLLGPSSGIRLPCKPGKRINLGPKRNLLKRTLKISSGRLFYYFFMAKGARSPVDWFNFQPSGR